jgi:uncharacterized tellurite resistance protein B-like protein
MGFVQGDAMTKDQVLALAACMLSTAHVDGVHAQEVALIRRFYDTAGTAGLPPFSEVEGSVGDSSALLKKAGTEAGFGEQLVLMCFATAYADGALTDGERAHVDKIAGEAGVSQAKVEELLAQVKDSLLGALSHLPDAASVANVAKDL